MLRVGGRGPCFKLGARKPGKASGERVRGSVLQVEGTVCAKAPVRDQRNGARGAMLSGMRGRPRWEPALWREMGRDRRVEQEILARVAAGGGRGKGERE